ncbi:SagB/ThcOx family dehydrogenase [Thermodesulfobacteriota bacterium]
MIATGGDYHRHTSYERFALTGHELAWSDQPSVFKGYPTVRSTTLSRQADLPKIRLSELIDEAPSRGVTRIDFDALSGVLPLAYGITAQSKVPGGHFYYRSVPSAGALYPCELYVASRSLPGLEDGLYHLSVRDQSLSQIRQGSVLGNGVRGARQGRGERESPVLTFFVTALFYRSSWKYRDRAYRYSLLDSGHLVENVVLSLRSFSIPCRVFYDFDDAVINSLLSVDAEREVCLAIIQAGLRDSLPSSLEAEQNSALEHLVAASRVAVREKTYSAIRQVHQASSRIRTTERTIRGMLHHVGPFPASRIDLPRPAESSEQLDFADTVLKRRSTRNFVPRELEKDRFDTLLALVYGTSPSPGEPPGQDVIAPGFLAGRIQGAEPGCYWVDRAGASFGSTRTGLLLSDMARACLDQAWMSHAALHFFSVTNLEVLEDTWGPRGYRYAMLETGRLGQRVYLGATALGLGCCGIGAFYDSEAAAVLGLNDQSSMLYLLAAGPVKKIF